MFVAIIVKPDQIPEAREYPSLAAILRAVGIRGNNWETSLINDAEPPYENVGIIAHDQDTSDNRKRNILGMRGTFAIVGMHRGEHESQQITTFMPLEEEEIQPLIKALTRQ